MSNKKCSLICLQIFLFLILVKATFAQTASVTIIREQNYYDSINDILVYMDKKPIVSLPSKAYITKNLFAGTYIFSFMSYVNGRKTIELEQGQHDYYLLTIVPGFFSASYSLIPVDSVYAKSAIKTKGYRKIEDNEALPERKKSRFGLNLGAGIGLKNLDMLESTEGEESSISFGGGLQLGAEYGIELNSAFDIAFQATYMLSSLAPPLKNASIDFSRLHVAIRPTYIIPIREGFKSRLKIGPGLDYYFNSTMNFKTNKIDGGFNGDWNYANSLAWHAAIMYEYTVNRTFMYTFGLRYSTARFTFDNSSSAYVPINNDLINGRGNSIDFVFGFFKVF